MTADREWILLAPRDMEKVVAAFAACLEELGITAVSRR